MQVRVELLGPLRVFVHGNQIAVERRQVRALLGLLAARASNPVSADALIDHLWADTVPKDPRAALSVVLSRLKSELNTDERLGPHLESSGAGYTLHASVDLHDFESALAQCRLDDGNEDWPGLRGALTLWRGLPFDGLPGSAQTDAIRLHAEEMRWEAINLLARQLARVRDFAGVVTLLSPVVVEAPYREGPAVSLAKGLAETGRKAEALDLLSRTRLRLLEDLGLDPSPLLARTEAAILDGDLDLVAFPEPRSEPSTFVGREAQISSVLEGDPPLMFLVGRLGSGKSALLEACRRRHESNGLSMVVARANQSPTRPIEVVALLVEQLLSVDSAVEQEDMPALSRVVPGHVPPTSDTPDLSSRDALIAGLASFIVKRCRATNVVIAIDDAPWVDLTSAQVLSEVIASGARVVLSHRPEQTGHMQRFMSGRTEAEILNLEPLTRWDVQGICQHILGESRTSVGDAVFDRTEGHALFANLVVRHLALSGVEAVGELPDTVVAAVEQALGGLSARAKDAALTMSVFGVSCSRAALRALIPTADSDLDELMDVGLVRPAPGANQVEFINRVISGGAYQMLPPARRVDIHDAAGRIIEDLGGRAIEFAVHASSAASIDPQRAVRVHLDAASEFAAAFEWESVLDHVREVRSLEVRPPALVAADVDFFTGAALRGLGRKGASAALEASAIAAHSENDAYRLARATIELCSHGETTQLGSTHVNAKDLLQKALGYSLDVDTRARLCAAGSTVFALAGSQDRVSALFDEALSLSEGAQTDTRCEVLLHTHLSLADPDRFDERVVLAAEMRRAGPSDPDMLWEADFIEFCHALVHGQRKGMRQSLVSLEKQAPHVRRRPKEFGLLFCRAALASATADLDGARRHLDEIRAREWSYPPSWVASVSCVAELAVRIQDKTVHEFAPAIETLLAVAPSVSPLDAVAAFVHFRSGDHPQAHKFVEALCPNDFDRLERDITWTGCMWLLAEPVAALGNRHSVERLFELLLPHSGRMSWTGTCSFGPVDGALACLAESLGDTALANEHRRRATAMRDELVAG